MFTMNIIPTIHETFNRNLQNRNKEEGQKN